MNFKPSKIKIIGSIIGGLILSYLFLELFGIVSCAGGNCGFLGIIFFFKMLTNFKDNDDMNFTLIPALIFTVIIYVIYSLIEKRINFT